MREHGFDHAALSTWVVDERRRLAQQLDALAELEAAARRYAELVADAADRGDGLPDHGAALAVSRPRGGPPGRVTTVRGLPECPGAEVSR
jgi:hypothetical protein